MGQARTQHQELEKGPGRVLHKALHRWPVCVYMYVCMCVFVSVCLCESVYGCVCLCLHVFVHVYLYVCVHMSVCVVHTYGAGRKLEARARVLTGALLVRVGNAEGKIHRKGQDGQDGQDGPGP